MAGGDRRGLSDDLAALARLKTAVEAQWRHLVARDGGCVRCGADPSRCQAHHLVPWQPPTHGPTDIDHLALVCGHDHHLVPDHGYALVHEADGTWTLEPP